MEMNTDSYSGITEPSESCTLNSTSWACRESTQLTSTPPPMVPSPLLKLIDGQIYYVTSCHIRDFGFPRVAAMNKVFKWKKMNYTTDLPKNSPVVSYLVATG